MPCDTSLSFSSIWPIFSSFLIFCLLNSFCFLKFQLALCALWPVLSSMHLSASAPITKLPHSLAFSSSRWQKFLPKRIGLTQLILKSRCSHQIKRGLADLMPGSYLGSIFCSLFQELRRTQLGCSANYFVPHTLWGKKVNFMSSPLYLQHQPLLVASDSPNAICMQEIFIKIEFWVQSTGIKFRHAKLKSFSFTD